MMDTVSYLISLLGQQSAGWTSELRRVLLSPDVNASQLGAQQCLVNFALHQAKRRIESSQRLNKMTFGIDSLIAELAQLDENETLDYYVVSTPQYLGTYYVCGGRLDASLS